MRVHVISDMEGVAGIVKWGQTGGDPKLYEEGRVLYTEEINAAVRGAKAAGATEIVVMDCHGAGGDYTFNSLVPDLLDPDCEYVVQSEWTEYTEFLEQGCDAALFVGMHAMAGTPTACSRTPCRARRGRTCASTGRSSARRGSTPRCAATWGCPVLLVTGDRAVCARRRRCSATALTTVEVKSGLGRFSARSEDGRAGARADRGRARSARCATSAR